MVLKLLELVASGHVAELLAAVVIQDCACLLVVTWSVAEDGGVARWHGHWTHADRDDVGWARVGADGMVRRHGRNDYVLHYLAKL